jgi:hypothetical protein
MEKLLELLKDGRSRTIEMLADELGTTTADVNRMLSYLESIGAIKKVSLSSSSCHCGSDGHCSAAECKGCMPQNAAQNMGEMWEVVR